MRQKELYMMMQLKKINNKGQVLLLFVLLLPIVLLIIIIGIEIALINIEKTNTRNTIKEIVNYSLSNYNEDIEAKINNLIDINVSYDEKTIFISEDEIRVKLTQNKKIFGKNIVLNYNYKGIKKEDKIIISEG